VIYVLPSSSKVFVVSCVIQCSEAWYTAVHGPIVSDLIYGTQFVQQPSIYSCLQKGHCSHYASVCMMYCFLNTLILCIFVFIYSPPNPPPTVPFTGFAIKLWTLNFEHTESGCVCLSVCLSVTGISVPLVKFKS